MTHVTMCEEAVQTMTQWITEFTNAALVEADMRMKMTKTYSQHIQQQEKVSTTTPVEIAKKMVKYKHTCEFSKVGCKERFESMTDMRRHTHNCNFNYGLTDEGYEIGRITTVFDKAERKLFMFRVQ